MCSSTPRFSYNGVKTVICTCPVAPWHGTAATLGTGMGPGWYQGGYTGWVPGRGIPVYYPATLLCCEEDPPTSDRRERALLQAGWVGCRVRGLRCSAAGTVPCTTTPCGRARALQALYRGPRGLPPLGPKGRDSMTYSIKLVKTAKCHQKCLKRPVIVPIFKKRVQKVTS